MESKKILKAYGIPTVETRAAADEDEAVQAAEEIGYPVGLKLLSNTIAHKWEAGGVGLNLPDSAAVRIAWRNIRSAVRENWGERHFLGVTVQPMAYAGGYEIILGSSIDPQFGPVLLFGSGGRLLEFYRDRALALPPLNTTLARRVMEQTRICAALKDAPANIDLALLEQLLVHFSLLVVEQRWIKEIDVNPLLVSSERIIALDARVVLHGPDVKPESIPELAIRPYPTQYAGPWTMADGTPVIIRPIRPEDEPLMVEFHETLSERSVYFRYFHTMRLAQRISHERLTKICFINYAREMVLVALRKDSLGGDEEIIAVCRLNKVRATREGEFAVLVSDNYHHRGLGAELLRRLVEIGREEKLTRIYGDILPENRGMLRICEKLGFCRRYQAESGIVRAEIDL